MSPYCKSHTLSGKHMFISLKSFINEVTVNCVKAMRIKVMLNVLHTF